VSEEHTSIETKVIELTPHQETPVIETRTAELPRRSNDRYKFIRSIGFGGMKAVLLVRDDDTGREVAMAMMPDFRKRPMLDIERFIREARLTAQLEHPNIVPVHDMGTDMSGAPFFVMKYLRGQSLATLLRRVRRGEAAAAAEYKMPRLLQIFTRVCNAVSFAHSKGVLHLDIKPNNVNIGDFGEVLLLDWGLALSIGELKRENAMNPLLRDGVAKGTPGFMSPEQASGRNSRLDERADIYGLGALLYTMLTLQNPLGTLPIEKVMAATVQGEIPPPTSVAPDRPIPAAMEAVCRKAMALEPHCRYQSVAELLEDIDAYRNGYATAAENASTLRKTALFVNRNFLVTMMVGIIVLLIGLLVYVANR
jgi:serine/threonine protein kinase